MPIFKTLFLAFSILLLACNSKKQESDENFVGGPQRFELLSSDKTGINFSNTLQENYVYNIINYEYLYNGGGVAIGDINNDGLPDVYFTATFGSNKLYLNKGNLQFEDITDRAGVAANAGFKTGVTMADVNGDGYLDIYVCRTSREDDKQKDNYLYINNKDLTFTNKAQEYNLAGNANTNHAAFFDFDLDGDLDLFMMNHRVGFEQATKTRLKQNNDGTIVRETFPLTPFESCHLYRNDNEKFTDISAQVGLNTSAFSLSATVADIDLDNYPDIFVSNDYIEPDFVLMNNKKGGLVDRYSDFLKHGSQNSMGSDVADVNNDGLPDIISLDMISEDPFRYKQLMNIMQFERYNLLLKYGYGNQTSRNMLHLNQGNNTFSEIAQLAGISNTDWSWSTSFADYDNDGFKDIYITNGYRRDVTDNDYMVYTRDSIEKSGGVSARRYPDVNQFLNMIPEHKLSNYMFRNKGDLSFENVTKAWGMDKPSYSNGFAYGDLDGDGDLDVVVNNINDPAFVFENKTTQQADRTYLQIKLNGPDKNKFGLGTKAWLYIDGKVQYQEMYTNRGFMSSSEPIFHFGTGSSKSVERLEVRWPDGKTQILTNVQTNKTLTLKYADAGNQALTAVQPEKPIFEDKTKSSNIDFTHVENEYVDFNYERLIPHFLSNLGPFVASGDVNGDHLDDVYLGGATGNQDKPGQAGCLYLQLPGGKFKKTHQPAFEKDKIFEDTDCKFFDADGDGDLDLVVGSGGNENPEGSDFYKMRLYNNDGKGNFTRNENAIQDLKISVGSVLPYDIDGDNDLDLIIGGRVQPGAYPTSPKSFVLRNDKGSFKDATSVYCPELSTIGMVTDIKTADLDGDKAPEIIVCGEWMPITIFKKQGTVYKNATAEFGLGKSNGWWNAIEIADFDKDGDMDIVAGNLGRNSRHKASEKKPIVMYAKDFDSNGSIDPVMCFTNNEKEWPYAQRDLLAKQIPSIKKKFPRYRAYSSATIKDVFGSDLESAFKLQTYCLTSSILKNEKGKFVRQDLPIEAQFGPVKCLLIDDYNKDGNPDILLSGNDNSYETETGVMDALTGIILLGDGKGGFKTMLSKQSGLWLTHEARDMAILKSSGDKKILICGNNNSKVQVYDFK